MKIVRGSQLGFIPASHENPENPGVLKRVLATGTDLVSGQVQMVNWSLLKAGKSFERHYHEDMQEVFIILSGQVLVEVELSGQLECHELQAGDAILIDAGEIHRMENRHQQDVEYLVFGISTGKGGKTVVVSQDSHSRQPLRRS